MNKNLYRIVFNRARGLLMVVAENVTSHSKGEGAVGSTNTVAGSVAQGAAFRFRLLVVSVGVMLGTLAVLPVSAGTIVADPAAPGNQRPTVITAPNGVPLVNIQTPSAAGVSRNTYSQFDVMQQGAILNNSANNVQTQLGGWVQGNSWLSGGTARVIVNEVNSNNPSLLKGYIEVAGSRAQVIISNPSGITCDGCGFINANRATVTTGIPIINSGNLDGYRVERGTVTVQGNGMDASSTDYTDIIARAVQVNAGIWANELKVTTGANQVDAAHTQATVIAGSGTAPAYALDVASLGGMYAGKITLVGTEAGLGVRNAGNIGASAGNIIVTNDGRIVNTGSINASANTTLNAASDISNSGTIYAGGDTSLTTQGNVANSNLIAALGNLNLTANGTNSQISNTPAGIFAAGLKSDGTFGTTGSLTLSATNSITDFGKNYAAEDQTFTAHSMDISGSQSVGRNLSFTATNGNLNASSATLSASNTLTASTTQTLTTDHATLEANQLNLTAHDLSNISGTLLQLGSGDTVINLAGNLDNTQGRIATNANNLTLSAATLTNTNGQLQHAGAGTFSLSATTLAGTGGQIQGNSVLNLTATTATLDGGSTLAEQISLDTASLSNRSGSIIQTGTNATTINATTQLDNTGGTIASNGNTTLTVGNLINQNGTIQAAGTADLSITATGTMTNTGGQMVAAGDFRVIGNTLAGSGKLIGGRDASVSLQGDYTQSAGNQIAANRNLSFTVTGDLTNTGTLQAVNNLDLNAARIHNQGTLGAGALLSATVATLSNSGTIVGDEVTLKATALIENVGPSALIGATNPAGKLTLLAPDIQNRDDTTATDTIPSATIYGMGHVVLAGGVDSQGQYIRATRVLNQSGLIESGGDMLAVADTLTNTRRVLQTSGTYSPTGSVSGTAYWTPSNPEVPGGRYVEPPHGGKWNSSYEYTGYSGTVASNSITQISPKGIIEVGGNLTPTANQFKNYWSEVAAVGNIALTGVTLDQDSWNNGNSVHPGTAVTPYGQSIIYSGYYMYRTYKGVYWTVGFGPTSPVISPIAGYDSRFTAAGTFSGNGVTINNRAGNSGNTPLGMPAIPTSSSVSGTGTPNVTFPSSSLYHANPNPTGNYYVETDARFTSYSNWLSSDYLLAQLALDPNTTQKRLGDGFYEQRLVREQLAELTGRRFLTSYSSDEAEYQALMTGGASFAQAHQLMPGVSLNAAQMSQLTSDIVWLVEKEVTLPDGTTAKALVPQVYLRPNSMTLTNTGSLIAAADINLANTQTFTNGGTMVADNSLTLSGQSLSNRGGTLQSGGAMQLASQSDIDLTSAELKAGSLSLNAAQNLLLNTDARQVASSVQGGSRTSAQLGRVASVDVAGNAQIMTGGNLEQQGGTLKVGGNLATNIGGDWQLGSVEKQETTQMGRMGGHYNTEVVTHLASSVQVGGNSNINVTNDLTAQGTQFDLQGGGTINVGRNLSLSAVKDSIAVDASSAGKDYAETNRTFNQSVIGTTLQSGKDITLQAGKDITITGSTLQVTQGSATLNAGNNITVQAETEQHTSEITHTSRHRGFFSSKTSTTRDTFNTTAAIGSTLSADSIAINSGNNLNIKGSSVVGTNDVSLAAGNNVNIESAQNTSNESHFRETRKSGIFGGGGLGFTIGKQRLTTTNDAQDVTNVASTVGSVQGNVDITAGKNYQQTGSHVLAPQGDINISAEQVNINAATDTYASQQTTQFKQSGLSFSLSSPVISAVQTASQMADAAGQTSDPRMKALAAATAGLAASNALDAVNAGQAGNLADQAGGLSLNVSIGSSKSSSQSSQTSSQAVSSTVAAGNNFSIVATGAGKDSDITVTGSKITAGNNAILIADDQINLQAATNNSSSQSSNKSSSMSLGASIGLGANGGISATASVSKGQGSSNGQDITHTNTEVTAGNIALIQSGTDTNIKGATVSGKQVIADVGTTGTGNLNIESLQDSSTYQSNQKSMGLSLSVPVTGAGSIGGSVNVAKSNINSNYQSVTEQSGIKAGDNGFQINVNGNTDLKGAVIASNQAAIDNNKNSLTTETLTTSNIQNQAAYQGEGASATIGIGSQGGLPQLSGVGTGSDSGKANSATVSAISQGNVNVTDNVTQQQKTGQNAVTTVALLNRDVKIDANGNAVDSQGNNTANAIKPIFDAEKVQKEINAQVQITQAFGQQANQAVDQYTQSQMSELRARYAAEKDPDKKQAMQAEVDQLRLESHVLSILIGAVTGQGATTVTKEGLSAAAEEMRKITIANSRLFDGVIDDPGNGEQPYVHNNTTGTSVGGKWDLEPVKTGGTRDDLDLLCGMDNKRCMTTKDENGREVLALKDGKVQWNRKEADGLSLPDWLLTPEGQKMAGATGGIQGAKGTLFGEPYLPGSWQDKLIEAFGGSHDFIGGQATGLYDGQGNIKRGMSDLESKAYDVWSGVAIAPAAPFAAATLLPPEVWQAIAVMLRNAK